MEESSDTIKSLNQNDLIEIYRCVAQYTIEKYFSLKDSIREPFKNKYINAQQVLQYYENTSKNYNEIIEYLTQAKNTINEIRRENSEVNILISEIMLKIIEGDMPKDSTEKEKCEFLFDFITSIMKPAEKYEKCIAQEFDDFGLQIGEGVPFPYSFQELLVTREAIGDDICNLLSFLGSHFNLNIKKTFCTKNDNDRHAINFITFEDGTTSIIDPIAVVKKERSKVNTFLTSFEQLNKINIYSMNENDLYYEEIMKAKSIEPSEQSYNIEETIKKVDELLPEIKSISLDQVKKRME